MEIDNELFSRRSDRRITIRFDPKDTAILKSAWDYGADAPAYPFEGKVIPLEKGFTSSDLVIYEVSEGKKAVTVIEVPRKIEVLDEEGKWVPYPSVRYTLRIGCGWVIFKDSDGKFKNGRSGRCFANEILVGSAVREGMLVD